MKQVRVIILTVCTLVLLGSKGAFATPPMVLGNADIAPFRGWELWLSFTYKNMKDGYFYTAPTLEIIYGILPRVELGIETSYIVEQESGNETKGIDYLSIQGKALLWEEREKIPAVAVYLQFEVPTDEEKNRLEYKDRIWAPSIVAQKHFGNTLFITQLRYFFDKNGHVEKWRYGIDVKYKWDNNLQLLAEIYTDKFVHLPKEDELNFRIGFKYKFVEYAKIYFAAGRSLYSVKDNRPLFEGNGGVMFEF